MITNATLVQVVEAIYKIAEKKARSDNPEFNAMDWSGGNFDDAFSMGCDDGEIFLARRLKAVLDNVPNAA